MEFLLVHPSNSVIGELLLHTLLLLSTKGSLGRTLNAKSCNSSARVVIFRELFDRTQHTFISLSCVLRLGSLDLVGCNSPSPYLSGKANASRASEAFSGLSSVPNNPLPPAAITTNCL